MSLEVSPDALVVDTCERCGRRFPHTDAGDGERAFCEPCRDALWRDEREQAPHETAGA